MKLQCKTCIVLAACSAKRTIECEIVYEILRKEVLVGPGRHATIFKETREEISALFPNVKYITKHPDGNARLTFKGFR